MGIEKGVVLKPVEWWMALIQIGHGAAGPGVAGAPSYVSRSLFTLAFCQRKSFFPPFPRPSLVVFPFSWPAAGSCSLRCIWCCRLLSLAGGWVVRRVGGRLSPTEN